MKNFWDENIELLKKDNKKRGFCDHGSKVVSCIEVVCNLCGKVLAIGEDCKKYFA